MGRRGPPPKPTALRVLHGDRKDRVNTSEPSPAAAEVRPPDWLGGEALDVWRRLAPDLERKGVLSAWDVEAFAVYCDATVRHARSAGRLDAEGEVVAGVRGNPMRSPWLLVWRDTAEVMSRVGGRFGLTPSDRSSLSVGGRRDQREDLLSG